MIWILDSLHAIGINAIIFQVRPTADALYRSEFEPISHWLTGKQGEWGDKSKVESQKSKAWDPLEWTIEEAHKRNMEVHVWLNPYRVTLAKTDTSSICANHIWRKHRDWFWEYNKQWYFDPGLEQTREWICTIVQDIVQRYDIQAVHMDDYFYPYPAGKQQLPDTKTFEQDPRGFNNINDWRRDNVNLAIKAISETIRECKDSVEFGISPFGVWRNNNVDSTGSATRAGITNYDDLYADILLWTRNGWVDYNIPQIYWQKGHPAADYDTLVKWWADHTEGRPLFIGQSIPNTVQYTTSENNELAHKMLVQRAYPTIGGSSQWYAAALIENQGGVRDAYVNNYHRYPALVPTFPFMDKKAPGKVKKLKPIWTEDGYMLLWFEPKAKTEMDIAKRYIIYRFAKGEKVNTADPSHIVAITQQTYYPLPYVDGSQSYTYVVTALDRLHNESKVAKKKVKL